MKPSLGVAGSCGQILSIESAWTLELRAVKHLFSMQVIDIAGLAFGLALKAARLVCPDE